MSLEDVRQVSAANPTLLSANLVSTCYRHTAGGHDAYHVCKSPGESQYTPPGFALRDVVGLDGKTYRCSGVSPDAIWCDGTIVDTIASCNEHERPIHRRVMPTGHSIRTTARKSPACRYGTSCPRTTGETTIRR